MCDKFDSAFALAAAPAGVTSGQGHLGIPAAAGVVNSSRGLGWCRAGFGYGRSVGQAPEVHVRVCYRPAPWLI